jgi:hypothetical protein
MNQPSNAPPVALMPYVLQLLGVFLLGSIIVTAFSLLTGIEIPNAMGIILMMAALSPVASSFTKKTERVMTTGERAKFAVLGTIATLLLSLVLLFVMLAISGVPMSVNGLSQAFGVGSDFLLFALIVLAVSLIVSWLVIYFGMGAACRMMMKQLEKAKSK